MRKILGVIMGMVMTFSVAVSMVVAQPAFAEDCPNGVETTLFGCVTDDGNGSGIFMILNTVLSILTYGVGIAGTLGIVISGVQYLTARDNAAQMEKAKNRLINIVIGLAVYAVMWGFLQWLLPGGVFGRS